MPTIPFAVSRSSRIGRGSADCSMKSISVLGTTLREPKGEVWPYAIAAAQFMALTGFRRGEVLGLRWADVDAGRRTATLMETKSGKSVRALSHAACDILSNLPRKSELIFPASRGGGQMTGFPKFWARIMKQATLPSDVTPHVLRHSFASLAADLGYSEPTIAALIGHKGRTITSRYMHSADAVLLQAANSVSDRIVQLMEEVTAPKPSRRISETSALRRLLKRRAGWRFPCVASEETRAWTMAYTPDWLSLADTLQRLVSTGIAEEDAKNNLCRAMADRKIDVRVRIAATGKVFSNGNVGVPP